VVGGILGGGNEDWEMERQNENLVEKVGEARLFVV
jgi:hypothetical protein